MISLPYTICFCLCGDRILMLHRRKSPNRGRWNGLGGKIKPGETPRASIQREMMEEAAIDLREAQELRFTGLVTWDFSDDPARNSGMYAFLARVAPDYPIWPDRQIAEGLLSWKPLDWVCDPGNSSVVSNIPRFLPSMLNSSGRQEYCCFYYAGELQAVVALPLTALSFSDEMFCL